MTLSEHSVQFLKAATKGDGNRIIRTYNGGTVHMEVENTNIAGGTPRHIAAFKQLQALELIESLGSPRKTGQGAVSVYIATLKGFELADSLSE